MYRGVAIMLDQVTTPPPLSRFGSLQNIVKTGFQPYPIENWSRITNSDAWANHGFHHCGGLLVGKVVPSPDDEDAFVIGGNEFWFALPVFEHVTAYGGFDEAQAVDLLAFGADSRRPLTWSGNRATLGPDYLLDPAACPRLYRDPFAWLCDGGPIAGCCIAGGPR